MEKKVYFCKKYSSRMHRLLALLTLLSMTSLTVWGQSRAPVWRMVRMDSLPATAWEEGSWRLVWHDEFNDSTLNSALWKPVTGIPRDLSLRHQKAWHTPENLEVRNGCLYICSRREHKEGMVYATSWDPVILDTVDFDYTTGEVWSRRLFSYGKYEAKIRLPKGYGLWPAFWLFSPNPLQDEIDIFEVWNPVPGVRTKLLSKSVDRWKHRRLSTMLHHALHYDYDSLHPGVEQQTHNYRGDDYYSHPHIYTLIYTPYHIQWLVDGEELWNYPHYRDLMGNSMGAEQLLKGRRYWENLLYPCHPLHLILNVAIQTQEDAPDESTPFPTEMEVDWVRFFELRIEN